MCVGVLIGTISPHSASSQQRNVDAALDQIAKAIGSAQCTNDSQCRVAGIGARSCGGPESFRAWSTQTTDASRLEPLLHRYAQERRAWNDKVGLMSTCEVIQAPGARCSGESGGIGRCVLDPSAAGLR